MQLFEAILEANQRGTHSGLGGDYAASLPIVALTCIDPRLNRLLPDSLNLPEEQFIWLRNAGNIITGSMSSTMRSLALACAVKGGKEIAIIGHSDCKVRHVSMVDLLERFRALGLDRSKLPDNLNDYFGLFASERQNVQRAVDFIRESPLIGAQIPVHGLLIDIQSGKLEWLVNGYETLQRANSVATKADTFSIRSPSDLGAWPAFNLGEMKFPEGQIGDASALLPSTPIQPKHPVTPKERPLALAAQPEPQAPPAAPPGFRLDRSSLYRVVGEDRKIYGPVSADELELWLAEKRIDEKTLAQKVGYKQWKALTEFAVSHLPPQIPIPPSIKDSLRSSLDKKKKH